MNRRFLWVAAAFLSVAVGLFWAAPTGVPSSLFTQIAHQWGLIALGLPAACAYLLFRLLRGWAGFAQSMVGSVVFLATGAVLYVELVSLFGGIGELPFLCLWLLLLLGLGVACLCRRSYGAWQAGTSLSGRTGSAIVMLILVAALPLLLIALVYPPNTWDVQTYHLPRLLHWVQQGTVAHFPTANLRQLYQLPCAEYLGLHLYLLSGTVHAVTAVQLVSFLLIAWLASEVTTLLGGGRLARIAVVLFVLSYPTAILQAPTFKNDLLLSLWLLCLVHQGLLLAQGRGNARLSAVLLILAACLCLHTKGTVFVYLPPVLAFALWVGRRGLREAGLRVCVCAGLLGVLMMAPFYVRNQSTFGSVLGPRPDSGESSEFVYGNETHAPLSLLSNAARNLAQHANPPSPELAESLTRRLRSALMSFGLDPDDPRTTWPGTRFEVFPYLRLNENESTAPLHMAFVVFGGGALLCFWGRFPSPIRVFGVCLVVAFVLFVAVLKWQPWHGRLHLPLFVLGACVAGVSLSGRRGFWLMLPLLGVMMVCCPPFYLESSSRPLKPLAEAAARRGLGALVHDSPEQQLEYAKVAECIARERPSSIAVVLGGDECEFGLWYAVRSRLRSPVFHHVGVRNESRGCSQPLQHADLTVVSSASGRGPEGERGERLEILLETQHFKVFRGLVSVR